MIVCIRFREFARIAHGAPALEEPTFIPRFKNTNNLVMIFSSQNFW